MNAAEVWCLVAVVAAVASGALCMVAPRAVDSYEARVACALLRGALAAIAVALWIAF